MGDLPINYQWFVSSGSLNREAIDKSQVSEQASPDRHPYFLFQQNCVLWEPHLQSLSYRPCRIDGRLWIPTWEQRCQIESMSCIAICHYQGRRHSPIGLVWIPPAGGPDKTKKKMMRLDIWVMERLINIVEQTHHVIITLPFRFSDRLYIQS